MTTRFKVPAVSCSHCERAIKKEVGAVAGVKDVTVDLTAKTVTVEHSDNVERDTLVSAISEAGFDVTE